MRIFKIGSVLAGVIAILGFLAAASFAQQDAARAVSRQLQNSGFPLPLVFEMNVGQVDARVKYLSRTHRGALFIESDPAVLVLSSPAVMPFRRGGNGHNAPIGQSEGVLAMRLIGANPIRESGWARPEYRADQLLRRQRSQSLVFIQPISMSPRSAHCYAVLWQPWADFRRR
jgi:hypothetical protein